MSAAKTLQLLPLLWRAEMVKLFSRLTARAGLVFFLVLALLIPTVHFILGEADVVVSGSPMNTNAPLATQWVLEARSFLTLRIFVIGLAALSFAGELKTRTLREDLLRPVPRWSVLAAKWATLVSWVAITTFSMWLVSAGISVILFGFGGDWATPMKGYLAVLVCDAGFVAFVLCIAVLIRSVIGTALGVVLYLIFDLMLMFALKLAIMVHHSQLGQVVDIPFIEAAEIVQPWLPISAFEAWRGFYPGSSFDWQNWVSLVVIFGITSAIAVAWFERTDVA